MLCQVTPERNKNRVSTCTCAEFVVSNVLAGVGRYEGWAANSIFIRGRSGAWN